MKIMGLKAVKSMILLLAQFASMEINGSFFKLQSGNNENRGGNQPSLTDFHLCSLNKNCSDVAENKAMGRLKHITGSEDKEKAAKDGNLIWKKMLGSKSLYVSCLKLHAILQIGRRCESM